MKPITLSSHLVTVSALTSVLVASVAAVADLKMENPKIAAWQEAFPDYVEMYMQTKEMDTPTPFGGNYPYSKLIRYPGKQALWAGYAFAVDFNEDRGHFYSQIDQMETKRNDLSTHDLTEHSSPYNTVNP